MSVDVESHKSVIMEASTVIEPPSPRSISPKSCNKTLDHSRLILSRWDTFLNLISNDCDKSFVAVGGDSLDVASVVAVARSSAIGRLYCDKLQTLT